MGALPKRRLSTGRQGRRAHDKELTAAGRGKRVGSRARRAAMKSDSK